jgi:capsular polysaccharide biosynthesis protein
VRKAWPLVGAVVGLAVAFAVTLLQDSTYRADASLVLVREGRPPGNDPQLAAAAEAAATLFESRAVAASALANLGLDESPDEFADRVDARSEPESSLVRLRVDAPGEEEARRAAQEVAEVATVLFNDRFGPQTVASVWEPADADPDRVSPKPARNLAFGALLGALAGWAAFLLARRPRRKGQGTVPGTVPHSEPASDAGSSAVRDEDVTLSSRERAGTVPGTVPDPEAAGPFVMPAFGAWTIADVERLVAEQGDAFPERAEEIELYLDTFRSVAGPDGRLPGDVDLVIEDVYADLIARSGSARRD